MKIKEIKTIRGPNVFHHGAILVMRLDLEEHAETHSAMLKDFNKNLLAILPGLDSHYCSPGRPGGFGPRGGARYLSPL